MKDWDTTAPPNNKNAIGDGVVDDTPNFQAAIEHLIKLGGGILYVPLGTYRLFTANMNVEAVRAIDNAAVVIHGSNITIEGEGSDSVIQCDGRIGGTGTDDERPWSVPFVFDFPDEPNTGNVVVRNLRFRGNVSPVPVTGKVNSAHPTLAGAGALISFYGKPNNWGRNIRIVDCTF